MRLVSLVRRRIPRRWLALLTASVLCRYSNGLSGKSEQPTASDTPGDASDCDIYQSVLSVLCQILYYLSLQSIIRVKTLSWAWNWVRRSGRGGAADRIGYSSLSTGDDYRDFFKVYRSRTLHEACEA